MTTVYEYLHDYCKLRELPPPSNIDLFNCGRIISHHFRHYWALQFPDGAIEDSHFVVATESEKRVVANAYPDIFQPEMAKRIDLYYIQKSQPKPPPIVLEKKPPQPTPKNIPKKQRKRIPINQKVGTFKPENIAGQTGGQV